MSDIMNLGRQVDDYIANLYSTEDAALQAALTESANNGLPHINVSANEGRLLYLLAKISGAKKILEIGTLGGYSTIWLARALPEDGKLITLEYSEKHASVARSNIEHAGLGHKVEIRVGAGLDLLPQIAANGEGPFDLFFIDADKNNYPGYLEWAIKLSHSGSLILGDNLIRNGAVFNPAPGDDYVLGAVTYNQNMANDPRLESIILPIIRDNMDGLGISRVK